ncbi:hypothetical protein GCM10023214_52340 [Amycolatopsis dongchuanensis]|uniref:HTH deoR-type domain-containing protein n=1 Tax=Amycolatopsis dongchuanensis TaxID=1070866 RepID=A0ABP9R5Q5_9PSEU
METSARLLRLLSLLQSPRDWTGAELAERLEVSPRTVRNDIERLRGLGYPVHAVRGSTGGYRLGAGAELPPLLLDDEEAVAVAIGLRTAGTVTGIEETSLRALAKLEQVLPSRLRNRVHTLQTYSVRAQTEAGPRVGADTLTAIAAACRDHECLRFDYVTHEGGQTRRTAEPYRIVNWGRRWYLVAWDVDRADWRTFRVDRMVPHTPNGRRFTPRDLPEEVTDRVMRGASSAAWRYRADVVVHAPAEVLTERRSARRGDVCAAHRRGHRRDARRAPRPAGLRLHGDRTTGTGGARGRTGRALPESGFLMFETISVHDAPEVRAPDGSAVRPLCRLAGASFARFELAPHQVSLAVSHATVEEIWFVLDGSGAMWRREGDREEVTTLEPGLCLTIPLGTTFQFRAGEHGLRVVAVTTPPWPGTPEEARPGRGPWDAQSLPSPEV